MLSTLPIRPTLALTLADAQAWMDGNPVVGAALGLAVLALVSTVAFGVVRRIVLPLIAAMIKRTPTGLDDALLERRTFHHLSWVVPLLIVYQGVDLLQTVPEGLSKLIARLSVGTIIVFLVRAFSAALSGINDVYTRYPQAKDRPIKGYLQVANILAHVVAAIFIVATLIDRSPVILLSGLGAMTAIIMLVFQNTLLSLVAGVQITTNNLIRVGDWIEMPQFNADGFVVDIALNTISVQNWDKTITVIPAHNFLQNSFKNWRGMQESGGRRIKRSINLDISSIRFLTEEEVDYFERFDLLRDYIRQKKAELEAHNQAFGGSSSDVNARRLTNVGTFRAYVTNYLAQHPGIHKEMISMVRQLQPTAEGLPIELYAFVNDVRWVVYEGVQSDVFDHIFAIIPSFGLRVFQNPSGDDLKRAFDFQNIPDALAAALAEAEEQAATPQRKPA